MDDIKAIQTEYNGYKFRSRLEARWAVFFDTAGIPYEYELQDYILPDGTRYLPDFYLPWNHAFVEIKHSHLDQQLRYEAMRKCESLYWVTEEPCVVLYCEGDPIECEMLVYCTAYNEDGGGEMWLKAEFIEGGSFNVPGIGSYEHGKHTVSMAIHSHKYDRFCDRDGHYRGLDPCSCMVNIRGTFKYAAKIARQARFEHGEKPNANKN